MDRIWFSAARVSLLAEEQASHKGTSGGSTSVLRSSGGYHTPSSGATIGKPILVLE